MADEFIYKKVTRKADKGLEGKVIAKHCNQTSKKLKFNECHALYFSSKLTHKEYETLNYTACKN